MASCKQEQKDNESTISTAYIFRKQRGFWSLTVLSCAITPRSHETVNKKFTDENNIEGMLFNIISS
jgi:hypothetical protein